MKIHLLKPLVMIAAVLGLAHTAVAQTATWSGASGTDPNWSTAGNWTAAGGGSAPPAATDTVIFGNGPWPAATNTQGLVDNIVTANTTVGGATYNNQSSTLNYFHTTQINAGATLTVNGLFSIGLAGQTCTDTMTGTGNFTVNNVAGNFNVGGGGISTATTTLTLADGTNTMNVNTLSMSESGGNNGRPCTLNLGAGPTFINANNVNLGTGKGQTTTITWPNPAHTNKLVIRNAAGTGRTSILMGIGSSASGAPNGRLLLAGHPVDILASTMTMGRISGSDTATCQANLTFDNGMVEVTSILMGDLTSTIVPGGGNVNSAQINVGGSTNTATLVVNSPGGPGGGVFLIGDSLTNHNAVATLTINQNGVVQSYCSIVEAQSTLPANNLSTITINGGTLNMEGAANTIGLPAWPIKNVTLNGATLHLFENGSTLNAAVTALTLNNTNSIYIDQLPIISSLPTTIPLITYSSISTDGNPSNLVMGASLPGSYGGYITNDGVSTISLVINSGTIVTKAVQWGGGANNTWDTTSFNWTNAGVAVKYADGDFVTFDDKSSVNTVNLPAARTPGSLTMTNNTANYTFSGSGAISGLSGLVKYGAASLTLAESGGDNFSGRILVHGGTLVLDNPNSNLSGALTNDAGTVVQIGNNDGNGTLPSGNLDIEGTLVFKRTNNVVVSAVIAGGGGLTQSGSGTLSLNAANTYTGATTVSAGTLAMGVSGTIASSLTVVKNATLDITPAASVSLGTVSLSNGTFNVGAGANSPGLSALSTSNSVITVIANYNNVGGSAIFTASSLTTGGSTNVINVTAIQNLPLSPTVPFNIPLISYSSATFNGGFNFGWTNLPGITGYLTNNAANNSVDLVVVSAPQNITWNGGSSTGNNWNDAANWSGTPVGALDALTFDGSVRVINTNDTAADTTYAGLTFNGGADPFTLKGNPINLTGTMVNNSASIQTVNLGLAVGSACTLDGGGSGGTLAINGGITNTAATHQTVSLLNAGTINDFFATSGGGQLEVQLSGSGAWTVVDGTGSGSLVQAGSAQLHVNPTSTGSLDFGTTNSAPNLDLGFTTNGNLTIDGTTSGTFNMNNGTLKVNSMTAANNGNQHGLFNMNGGTLLIGSGGFTSGGGNGGNTLAVTITNGSVIATNGGNFQLTARSPATLNQSGGLLQCGTFVPTTGLTIGGNGIYNLNGGTFACTNISIGSAGNNAWGAINYNGGTLKLAGSSGTFFRQINLAILTNSVQVGGAIFDTAGFSTALNLPLVSDPTTDPNQGGTAPDGGLTKLGAGTLTLSSVNTYNGGTSVGGGTLLVNGSIINTSGVTVSNNATLGGNGVIGSNVMVNAGGTLSPGNNAIGTLAVNGNVSLGGTNLMEVDKVAATQDLLLATNADATTITYGGTLKVVTLAGAIVATDTFKLFSASNYAGAFTALSPVTPGAGLGWNTNTLTTDGTLRVVATVNTNPTNITTSVSGNTLTLSWPADHTGWKLQVQTNALNKGLGTNWIDVPGSTSVNSTNITINPASGSVFYRMTYP